jgi:hypothetical protein
MSCVQDVNVNMLALVEGLLDLSKVEGNLNFGTEFLRECHKSTILHFPRLFNFFFSHFPHVQ